MLQRLLISNYALIDNLDISFSANLNIITGETGAGKSIIMGALSLILGQRAESRFFFNQQKKCVIEGTFRVTDFHLKEFFSENDLDYEEETVLRREISSDGKSRAFINDTPVNLTVLKQAGEQLIDIHSQHATLEINDERFQLLVVDTIAGNDILLSSYKEIYHRYLARRNKLKELQAQAEQLKADADYFQFQFDELDNAKLQADEQPGLEQELESLTHAEDIKRSLITAISALSEAEPSAMGLLKEASLQVAQAEKYNAGLKEFHERLESTLIEIKDIASELDTIEQKSNVDERRLEEVSERLDLIYSLQKKHRVSTNNELIEIRDGFSEKLNSILSADDDIDQLTAEVEDLFAQVKKMSLDLREARKKAIPSVEDHVKTSLHAVGMPNAILTIVAEPYEDGKFDARGADRIRFLFSANKGQDPQAMNKVASGGELSRLMLSIKSLIAKHTALPTIIFDEIDTGISGEVALKVGTIMNQLATNMQVIAITHLPQIAAKGTAHYSVYKEETDDITSTNIRILDKDERVREIARMLSGNNPGESAIMNARELLS